MILSQFSVKQTNRVKKFLDQQLSQKPDCLLVFGPRDALGKEAFKELFSFENIRVPVFGTTAHHAISNRGTLSSEIVVSALKFPNSWGVRTWSVENPERSLVDDAAEWMKENGFAYGMIFVQSMSEDFYFLLQKISQRFSEEQMSVSGLYHRGSISADSLLWNGELLQDSLILVGWQAKTDVKIASGWQPFGPVRKITKVEKHWILRIDSEDCYEIYRKYMGLAADDFIRGAKNLPLMVIDPKSGAPTGIRTFQAMRESDRALSFSGPVLEGQLCRFAHSTNKRLLMATAEVLANDATARSRFVFASRDRLDALRDDAVDEIEKEMPHELHQCGAYADSVIVIGDHRKDVLQNQTLLVMNGVRS